MKAELWERLRRLIVVVRGLIEPPPWRWGHVEMMLGGPELSGLGRLRLELVHGQTWVRIQHLQRSGAWIETISPANSVDFLREMSEDEVRRRILPDPLTHGVPCAKMELRSCRPGLCAWCGFAEAAHNERDIAQAVDKNHALRVRIAQVLSKSRLRLIGWDDVLVLVTLDATQEDAPGKDRVLDVALRRGPGDMDGERISREEWDRLMHDGLPLFPWSQASRTWAPPAEAPPQDKAFPFRQSIANLLSMFRGCAVTWEEVLLTFDREQEPDEVLIQDVFVRGEPGIVFAKRITREEWDYLVSAGLRFSPRSEAPRTGDDAAKPADKTSL